MKSINLPLHMLILLSLSTTVLCFTFFFGENKTGGTLIHNGKVKLEAIPLKKRIKTYNYNGNKPIRTIVCYDYQNSEASVNATDGGVGFNFVELRFKSQRSRKLDYSIEIYT